MYIYMGKQRGIFGSAIFRVEVDLAKSRLCRFIIELGVSHSLSIRRCYAFFEHTRMNVICSVH